LIRFDALFFALPFTMPDEVSFRPLGSARLMRFHVNGA